MLGNWRPYSDKMKLIGIGVKITRDRGQLGFGLTVNETDRKLSDGVLICQKLHFVGLRHLGWLT